MSKIIYSTYHTSSLFSKEKIDDNFFGLVFGIFFLFLAGLFFLISLIKFFIKSFDIIFGNTENITTLLWSAFMDRVLGYDFQLFVVSSLIIGLFIFANMILRLLHFVLTTTHLYLFSPLFPLIIHRIPLKDINFIRVKTAFNKKDYSLQTTFIIHLKNNKQKPYSMPWTDTTILKEKLDSLDITNVWYDFLPTINT